MDNIQVSLIICTYNRAVLLEKCLESLVKQQFSPDAFEAIIIDNNSNDTTIDAVSKFKGKIENFKYVFETSQGLSYARNRGCKEAAAEYLIYLDDDAIAPPEYLTNVAGIIKEHAPDIMGGPVYPYYTTPKPRWFKDEYEIRKYAERSGFSATAAVSGGNFIIRKKLLENLGGFDVDLGMKGGKMGLGEERKVLEQYRAATPPGEQKVYYALECFITHHVPPEKMKLRYVMKRAYLAGKQSQEVITSYHQGKTNEAVKMEKTSPSILKKIKDIVSNGFFTVDKDSRKRLDCVKILQTLSVYAGIYIGANMEKLSRKRNLPDG
jgi:glucosyl-dolichyl phosphate glucuronosyltransferase